VRFETNVRFCIKCNKIIDFLAAITVTDCENTWNFYKNTQETSILLIAITDSDCPRLPLNRALMV